MLDTLPYADLLTIHNTLAERPMTRSDTRANGIRDEYFRDHTFRQATRWLLRRDTGPSTIR